ncbi:hypothetical protein MMC10_000060 [Thelotrema lepadinum]|nr:hypothetical protein [Thelotrema lepadinum]
MSGWSDSAESGPSSGEAMQSGSSATTPGLHFDDATERITEPSNNPITPQSSTSNGSFAQSSTGQQANSDAEAYKAAGNKFFKAGDFRKAVDEYGRAIAVDPHNSTYPSNRSAAYMGLNLYGEALEDAKRADLLEPGNSKVLLRLARIYTALGRPSEALSTYAQIRPPVAAKDKLPASTMQSYVERAESALSEGTAGSMILHVLDQAERGLGAGVDKPRKWKLMRSEAYLRMGNVNALGDAQNVVMSLLRSNNQDPDALVLRGRVLYAQGENEKSIQHFRQALNYDPDFKDAVRHLRMVQKLERAKEDGNTAFKGGKFSEAVRLYGMALEVDPTNRFTNSRILQNRALASIKLEDHASAIDDCVQALSLDPSYLKARKTKARAMGESGNWEEAVREYKAIAESNPSEPGIAKDIRNAELELKKSKRKDYYKILGIEKDAGEHEIKRAYRKLAIVLHPDKNPGNDEAEHKFKELGEAYETLSDPQKRARYDSGEDLIDPSDAFGGGGMGGFPGGVQIDPEMLFNMMGGGMGGRGASTFSFSTGGGSPFGASSRQRGGFPGGFGF